MGETEVRNQRDDEEVRNGQTDKWKKTNRQDRQTDRQTDKETDGQTGRQTKR